MLKGLWLATGIIVLVAIAIMCAGCFEILKDKSAQVELSKLEKRIEFLMKETMRIQALVGEGKIGWAEGAVLIKTYAEETKKTITAYKNVKENVNYPWYEIGGLILLNVLVAAAGGTKWAGAAKSARAGVEAVAGLVGSIHAARLDGEDAEVVVATAMGLNNELINAEAEKLDKVIPDE